VTVVRRVNLVKTPTFTLGVGLWSTFGGATLTTVTSIYTTIWGRLTFPTAGAGVAGAQITLAGLTVGSTYRTWIAVPSASGTTTVQIDIQGIAAGAVFATNGSLFKEGAFTFTATATTATLRLKTAIGSTAGHYVDISGGIVEVTQSDIVDYAYFDGSFPGAYFDGPTYMAPSVFGNYDTTISAAPYSPMIVVEFDARPVTSTDFVLDRNALDDSTVALIDSPRWLHVTEAETVDIRRGRQDPGSEIGAGTADITLRDYDGIYDPDNPATPLQINGVPVMRAGMRIRVSALFASLGSLRPEPLIVGSLYDVQIGRTREPIVTVTVQDDLAKLNDADIPPFDPPVRALDQTFWRAIWALGFAGLGGWVDATYGSNMNRTMLATAGGGNVGSLLRQVSNCEGGRLFAQRDGRIHVGTHSDDFSTNPAAAFTDSGAAGSGEIEFDNITTSTSIRTLINRTVVDRGDQADTVSAQDDDSVALNQRVYSETIDAPLASNSEALSLAMWRATRRSRSATRVDSLTAQLLGQDFDAIVAGATLDLGNVIRVKRYAFGRGIDDEYGVEGIDHSIDVAGGWQITVYTSPLDITGLYADQPHPFILDTSALDSADILSAY
jgi:hypothetical protein